MAGSPPSRYEDIDVIKDADGVVAVFTQHRVNKRLAVAFFREFDRDGSGEMERTSFLNRRHLDAVERLIPQARKRLEELQTEADQAEAAAARAESSGKRRAAGK